MFKKKFVRKLENVPIGEKLSTDLEKIEEQTGLFKPEVQYMNNYQGAVSRMKCFQGITEADSLLIGEEDEEEEENGYQHCDANQYELYLHEIAQEQA